MKRSQRGNQESTYQVLANGFKIQKWNDTEMEPKEIYGPCND